MRLVSNFKPYFIYLSIIFRRDDLFNVIKLNYIAIKSNNISVFGISKSKTLSDFVTTESDVKKGTNRLPLKLARIYDEDLMSEEEVEKR